MLLLLLLVVVVVVLVARSRLPVDRLRLLAGVSAPRPTHFLCWCKESKPRKHLQGRAVAGL